MNLLKIKLIAKKSWLYAKKFWWILVTCLLLIIAFLLWALTRNGAFVATLMELLEAKNDAHDSEMETLTHIHNTEVEEKNIRLKEHQKKMEELEEEFKNRNETLDRKKKAELKKIVDESYNDPEKLAKEIADAFGLKHG